MGFEGFWSGQAGKRKLNMMEFICSLYARNNRITVKIYFRAGGAPATSANAAGAAAIVGALAGIPGGPLGVVVGAVSAGLTTAIGSTVGSGSASSSAGGGS